MSGVSLQPPQPSTVIHISTDFKESSKTSFPCSGLLSTRPNSPPPTVAVEEKYLHQ